MRGRHPEFPGSSRLLAGFGSFWLGRVVGSFLGVFFSGLPPLFTSEQDEN